MDKGQKAQAGYPVTEAADDPSQAACADWLEGVEAESSRRGAPAREMQRRAFLAGADWQLTQTRETETLKTSGSFLKRRAIVPKTPA